MIIKSLCLLFVSVCNLFLFVTVSSYGFIKSASSLVRLSWKQTHKKDNSSVWKLYINYITMSYRELRSEYFFEMHLMTITNLTRQ